MTKSTNWRVILPAGGAALAAVIGLACTGPEPATDPNYGAPCVEDMSCWDCETMGNHVCGTDESEG